MVEKDIIRKLNILNVFFEVWYDFHVAVELNDVNNIVVDFIFNKEKGLCFKKDVWDNRVDLDYYDIEYYGRNIKEAYFKFPVDMSSYYDNDTSYFSISVDVIDIYGYLLYIEKNGFTVNNNLYMKIKKILESYF